MSVSSVNLQQINQFFFFVGYFVQLRIAKVNLVTGTQDSSTCDEMLRTMMFIILPVAAVIILWQRNLPDENRDDGTLDLKKILLALAIGLGIGLYDGIMGPGTGTFAIIAFTTLMGFDLRTANGNGKVLNLASNYASLFTYLMNGLVVFHIGIPCAVSNILGNLLGSHFALKKGARFIRPMMLVVLVLLLGKLISDAVL